MAPHEQMTIDVWREDKEPEVQKEVINFKPCWTIAELKNHLKTVTGLGIQELVILFQDHQLTDNIRITGEELRILREHGGFRLRKRTQPCGNKRLFSKGIRGLPAFLARTFGMFTGDGRPIEMYTAPPPPPPPPSMPSVQVQFFPSDFNNIIYDNSLALAAETEGWNSTPIQNDLPPPPTLTFSTEPLPLHPPLPTRTKRKSDHHEEVERASEAVSEEDGRHGGMSGSVGDCAVPDPTTFNSLAASECLKGCAVPVQDSEVPIEYVDTHSPGPPGEESSHPRKKFCADGSVEPVESSGSEGGRASYACMTSELHSIAIDATDLSVTRPGMIGLVRFCV
ncbi:hypothetical protein HDU67_007446 [Dinochytrium kinnereticum]|nr:hypothetical protein HDU67_007446 [Dinochytrium kinnereticum]